MSKTSKFNGKCENISFNHPAVSEQSIVTSLVFRVKATGNRYRICIRKNAYEFQSYGRLQAWTTEKGWETIENVNPTNYTEYSYVSAHSCAFAHVPVDCFDQLIRDLMRVAVSFDQ